jgi:site-specific recombinase XerD
VHPDFEALAVSWDLTLDADGYSHNTRRAYALALRSLGQWLAAEHPGVGPIEMGVPHVRGWISYMRTTTAPNTIRGWFAGVRHFCRWLVSEQERTDDATHGIRTPTAGDPVTPTLKPDELKALIKDCDGTTFIDRRDAAILYGFIDGGLRLSENAQLGVVDVDIRDRLLFVIGKGSNRSGPRRRAVQLGVKGARAFDRYLRERRKHPFHESPKLWLGARNRESLSAEGIEAMVHRRATRLGIDLHPHMFRHTWASEFRRGGGEEGDLMVLGGWRSRQMLDRYGRHVAQDRALSSYRQRSLGDRL